MEIKQIFPSTNAWPCCFIISQYSKLISLRSFFIHLTTLAVFFLWEINKINAQYKSLITDTTKWSFVKGPRGEVIKKTDLTKKKKKKKVLGNHGFYFNIPIYDPYLDEYFGPFERPVLRLGDEKVGAEFDMAFYEFSIPEGFNVLAVNFKIVFEDPGHEPHEQPTFKLRVFSKEKGDIGCSGFQAIANASLGYKTKKRANNVPIIASDWTMKSIGLSDFAKTDSLMIEFSIEDCSLTGHFGYVYIDAYLTNAKLRSDYCNGDSIAKLIAPEGFSGYIWSTGLSGQQIEVPLMDLDKEFYCDVQTASNCPLRITGSIERPDSISFDLLTTDALCAGSATGKSEVAIEKNNFFHIRWDSNLQLNDSFVVTSWRAGKYAVIVFNDKGCTKRFFSIGEPLPIKTSHATSNYNGFEISCFGGGDGWIEVIPEGGTSPYDVILNSTFLQKIQGGSAVQYSNLCAGVHNLLIIDNNKCHFTMPFELKEPDSLFVKPIPIHPLCSNTPGEIKLEVFGGVELQNVWWVSQDTIVSHELNYIGKAGRFKVWVRDKNGCLANNKVRLIKPDPFDFETNTFSHKKHSSIISVKLRGGTRPYKLKIHAIKGKYIRIGKQLFVSKPSILEIAATDENGCPCDKVEKRTKKKRFKSINQIKYKPYLQCK